MNLTNFTVGEKAYGNMDQNGDDFLINDNEF
jgi:hypothetical protein